MTKRLAVFAILSILLFLSGYSFAGEETVQYEEWNIRRERQEKMIRIFRAWKDREEELVPVESLRVLSPGSMAVMVVR